ncbi:MAG: non-hydrolyzing UDP-N-acetylglucosamine 2-epimerase [Elusimicrobiota bacterium]
MKVVTIVGARPQFIKMAPLSRELWKHFDEIVIHTGQHYDYEMNKIFFEKLDIPTPDYNLGVGSSTHAEQTGQMLIGIEKILRKVEPDYVLVYGDTNSTLAGTLAAVKLNIPVGHVEAGLRSFDRSMPEEINRVLTDHASDVLFAPTETALRNIKKEGIIRGVYLTGDVMFDALINNIKIAEKSNVIEKHNLQKRDYLLTTVHRPSNTDNKENLENILKAFSAVNERIIFPAHPRTIKFIRKHGLTSKIGENVSIIDPVSYLDFLWLEKNAKKILTDSGGVQKEAYLLNIPCITLRKNTEWVETVEGGWNILVDTNKEKIIESINDFTPKKKPRNVFGNGKACTKIVRILKDFS